MESVQSAAYLFIAMQAITTHITLRIDWSEMDLFGHVNNVSFFKYVQAARVNFWEQIGVADLYKTQKIGFTVASVNCQFKKPLYYPGSVKIDTHVEWIKNSSLQLAHTLINDAGEIAAMAEDVIVMFDYTTNEKVIISEEMRKLIGK